MKFFFVLICFLVLTMGVNSQAIPKWKINDLENYIKKSKTPVVINFWATFCKPCIEEIPYFHKLVKQYEKQGVKLLLVSLDMPEQFPKIRNFAVKRKYTAPIVWLDESDADYFCPKVDVNWSGTIPSTLFINNKSGYRKFFEDQISKDSLENEINVMINFK
jgi:thiol-disulfide isomerase/thioredoxin